MMLSAPVQAFWQAFARTQSEDPGPRLTEVSYFDDNAASADVLAQLVLTGRKRATAGLVWSFDHARQRLPQAGDLAVVTDFAGTPVCITRTCRVDIVAFEDVDAEFAATEGEGDGSLAYWREVHTAYFQRECARIARVPDLRMPVVCERFERIYPVSVVP